MHLIKPSWLVHKDEHRKYEIYSVSASPDAKRLASGGLDGKVRIWSIDAINDTVKKNISNDTPKQLCSMSTHNGAVTVVRFSPNGKYLASGSDDRVVLIWELDESRQPRKEFGSQDTDYESWVARKRLIGHDNDVQDLAWSPNGSLLVTVGLDSSVIVWSGTTFEKIKRFDTAHQSHVKGVTFDPANKYFATASDDRTVTVFRYHREGTDLVFSIEARIGEPFANSPLSTYFRRLSWSPDGSDIVASNSTNGPITTAVLINRGTWSHEVSFVGHDAPCEVALFSPRIFTSSKGSTNENDFLSIVATSGQDKSLVIWNSRRSRPLLVIKNAAGKAITDLSWSPNGLQLFASSLDGTIVSAVFEEGEIGWVLEPQYIEQQLERYGGRQNELSIPESVEQIALEDSINKETSSNKIDNAMANRSSSTVPPTNGISSESRLDAIMGAPDKKSVSSDFSAPSGSSVVNDLGRMGNGLSHNGKTQSISNAAAKSAATQKITVTKDGKKRLTPLLVSSGQTSQQRPSVSSARSTVTEDSLHVMELSKPSYALPKGGVSALVVGTKRKNDEETGSDGGDNASVAQNSKKSKQEEVPEFIRPVVVSPASTVAQVRLAVPKVRTFMTSSANDPFGPGTVLEVRNGSGNEQEPTRVMALRKGQIVFADYLPKYGHLLTGKAGLFWAIATEDGTIYLYSPSGRKLIPGLVLGSPVSFLESQGDYLVAVTAVGMVHLWNVREMRSIYPQPISLAPILDAGSKYAENGILKAPSLTQCGVTKDGKLVITLNNGQGFTYSDDMATWVRVSEAWWTYGSQYWDTTGNSGSTKNRDETSTTDTNGTGDGNENLGGVVSLIERRTNDEVVVKVGSRGRYLQSLARNRMMQEGYEGFEGVVSTSHLENRIGSAILLNSPNELKRYLITYVHRISENGMRERLSELCKELLGPIASKDSAQGDFDSKICGLDRHDLLKLVVKTAGQHREVQQVLSSYASILEMT